MKTPDYFAGETEKKGFKTLTPGRSDPGLARAREPKN
jgi:hypothetical protein